MVPEARVALDRARNAIDLVAATVDARFGVVKHAVFGPDLINDRAPTRGVVFAEDVVKIAGEQGRYAVGHGLSARLLSYLKCLPMHFDKRWDLLPTPSDYFPYAWAIWPTSLAQGISIAS
jgi:hypothetical protein